MKFRWLVISMRIVLVLYLLVIVVLSLIPSPELPNVKLSDKLEHAIAYAGLATLLVAGVNLRRVSARSLVLAFVIANLFGIGLELIQPMTGRTRDVNDMIANFIGSLIGLGFGTMFVITLGLLFPNLKSIPTETSNCH